MPRRIKTPKKERVTIAASVSPALAELVAKRADEVGLTRSGFIALALADYLEDYGQTPESNDLDALAGAYADAHEGEQLRLGYSSRMREEIEAIVNDAIASNRG